MEVVVEVVPGVVGSLGSVSKGFGRMARTTGCYHHSRNSSNSKGGVTKSKRENDPKAV